MDQISRHYIWALTGPFLLLYFVAAALLLAVMTPVLKMTESITDDGKRTPQPRKTGTAGWSEAAIHQVKNTGTTSSHAVRIELKF